MGRSIYVYAYDIHLSEQSFAIYFNYQNAESYLTLNFIAYGTEVWSRIHKGSPINSAKQSAKNRCRQCKACHSVTTCDEVSGTITVMRTQHVKSCRCFLFVRFLSVHCSHTRITIVWCSPLEAISGYKSPFSSRLSRTEIDRNLINWHQKRDVTFKK